MAVQTLRVHRLELPTPFPVGTVNAYLVEDGDRRVLVDCGPRWGPARDALEQALEEAGVRADALSAVVLTHGHVDHVGQSGAFARLGVPVYAHRGVEAWLQPGGASDDYRSAFFRRLHRMMGTPEPELERCLKELFLMSKWNDRSVVSHPLREGDVFPLMPDFEVLEVPGHAQAAIALWNRKAGIFIGGDQLLPHVSSNAFIEPEPGHERGDLAPRTRSLLQYRESLQQLRRLDLGTVYPGHGDPFDHPGALVDRRLREQERRRDQFFDLVQAHPGATAYTLANTYFPRHRDQLQLILSETLGFLDWLEAEGRVVSETNADGVVQWRAV
ncbi:MBL fold metallo-hydrolase [Alicyclobacillus macrosporangiidus]|uniref:Glyoxylase, beta-lactamase superfamily II n=1 Tax=Alicyclobacillus macrosporangiidus TaxID=392015 RepID=A0A1I7KN37_9BACL|nr:MBL fold metallo-hydrolase [Alicyclobacillus macrosporangiidus]SFU98839.1 Glyoxylase, beta-lactamase superfamily II [Alicyclobacillus macrosporangiidus]